MLIPNWLYDKKLRKAIKTKNFSYNGLKLTGKVVSVYDGDTCTIVFRYQGKLQQHSCRMLGYDSPEMKPPKKNKNRDAEIEAAQSAKKALEEQVSRSTLVTVYCYEFDKYGRILVTLHSKKWCGLKDDYSINDYMIEHGYGYPYEGGKKKVFKE